MTAIKKRNREPIPGYRLLERLGRGGCGEVWKCEAPGGLCKAIKFVDGERTFPDSGAGPAIEELRAIQHIKSLRHPFILSMERVESIDGELVIVMELADASLCDLLKDHRARGDIGVPRRQLLRYLGEAADALDVMNLRHGLQHLDVKPGNLLLVGDHIKVADFGLVRPLTDCETSCGGALISGGLTAPYAAPELFRNAMSSSSDQYSLAIVYHELMTGTLPFRGKNARQLALQHTTAEPDLSGLPAQDRTAMARALSKNPAQRYPSCTEFVQALASRQKSSAKAAPLHDTVRFATTQATAQHRTTKARAKDQSAKGERKSTVENQAELPPEDCAGSSVLLAELIVEARTALPSSQADRETKPVAPGVLEDRFSARFSPRTASTRFETFRHQWNARILRTTNEVAVFEVPLPGSFWRRWLGQQRGLLVELHTMQPPTNESMASEMLVRIRCSPKGNPVEDSLVQEIGPLIVESLRAHLEAFPERRTEVRAPWPHPVRVTFYREDNSGSECVEGKGKDISVGGMGLYLPRAFAGSRVRLELTSPSRRKTIALLGNCVRVQRCDDGQFETGILF